MTFRPLGTSLFEGLQDFAEARAIVRLCGDCAVSLFKETGPEPAYDDGAGSLAAGGRGRSAVEAEEGLKVLPLGGIDDGCSSGRWGG